MRLGRRHAMRGTVALLALPWTAVLAGTAEAGMTEADLMAAIRERIGDAPIIDGGVELRLPGTAENGAQVPLIVIADSPMTVTDYVAAIHLFATRNPTPGIASFHLSPALARAEVQTRIRIAEEQTVIALAVHADGQVRRAVVSLKVTTGGCLA
ncbi:MAG: sulfur oxidation protein SoxY [Acetobacteraceae bacterium]|nr:sulfur oxidation protein SoxY [Acetobacteraceae bacterium]